MLKNSTDEEMIKKRQRWRTREGQTLREGVEKFVKIEELNPRKMICMFHIMTYTIIPKEVVSIMSSKDPRHQSGSQCLM